MGYSLKLIINLSENPTVESDGHRLFSISLLSVKNEDKTDQDIFFKKQYIFNLIS